MKNWLALNLNANKRTLKKILTLDTFEKKRKISIFYIKRGLMYFLTKIILLTKKFVFF